MGKECVKEEGVTSRTDAAAEDRIPAGPGSGESIARESGVGREGGPVEERVWKPPAHTVPSSSFAGKGSRK